MPYWIWGAVYALVFLEALAAAALLAPLTIPLARRFGFVAAAGERHIHKQPTTTLGGLAIVGGFFAVILGNLLLARLLHPILLQRIPEIGQYVTNIPSVSPQLAAVLGGALAMCLLGLADDKWSLGPRVKLIVTILATLPLLWTDVRIRGFLPWPWMGALATMLWVVFLCNSFNFLDNMDGLTGGIALIATCAFGLISFFAEEWFMTAIYVALAGSLLGFLIHNFYPARLFMGDNGSLFIGYMIGSLSILSTYYKQGSAPTLAPVLTPVIVLGVPIFDTVSVLWIRWRSGRPLMRGDKNHFSHRLLDLGFSQRRAATFIYAITAAVALGAVPLQSAGRLGAAAILVQTALLFWIIHRIERAARNHSRATLKEER